MSLLKLSRRMASQVFNARVRTPVSTAAARIDLGLWGATVGERLRVNGFLRLHVDGALHLGSDVRINSGPSNNFVGGDRRMSLWVGKNGVLTIADGCALSNSTIVCTQSVHLHEDVFIGGGCEIYDTDFHPIVGDARVRNTEPPNSGPIEIGRRAFVGGWSIVLKNVTIGEGAVIGAGSLVNKSVPAGEIWAGVPARKVGEVQ